jgi:hypothetical protein
LRHAFCHFALVIFIEMGSYELFAWAGHEPDPSNLSLPCYLRIQAWATSTRLWTPIKQNSISLLLIEWCPPQKDMLKYLRIWPLETELLHTELVKMMSRKVRPFLTREKTVKTDHTPCHQHQVMIQAKTGVMQTQVKECQWLLATTEARRKQGRTLPSIAERSPPWFQTSSFQTKE